MADATTHLIWLLKMGKYIYGPGISYTEVAEIFMELLGPEFEGVDILPVAVTLDLVY